MGRTGRGPEGKSLVARPSVVEGEGCRYEGKHWDVSTVDTPEDRQLWTWGETQGKVISSVCVS